MTKKELKGVFAEHPTVNEVFVTSDNQVFFTEEAADSHASRLLKKDIEPHSRFENSDGVQADEFLQDSGHGDNLVTGSTVAGGSEYITIKNDGKPSVIFNNTDAVKAPDAGHTVLKAIAPAPVSVTGEAVGAAGTDINNTAAAADVANNGVSSVSTTQGGENIADAAGQGQSAAATNDVNSLKVQGEGAGDDKAKKAAEALQKAINTPEAERTGYQKGLITKAANEAKAKGETV